MDLASGLHRRLSDVPALREAAAVHGRQLFDVRHPAQDFEVATGVKRPGKRLLEAGTDCSVGKMYTTLACEREMRRRGLNDDFRAAGHTRIFIAGGRVSLVPAVADFNSRALVWLPPATPHTTLTPL